MRYPGVVLMSVAMALHAVAAGRYLESLFFLVAFCWAWVAVTALRGSLQSAQSMVLTMLGLLILIVLPVSALRLTHHSLVAHMSLAIVPGIVSWACMFLYIRHETLKEQNGGDAMSAEADDWMTVPPAATKAQPPALAMPLLSETVMPSAPVIALPLQEAHAPSEEIGAADTADLTIERVAEILATLRSLPLEKEAA